MMLGRLPRKRNPRIPHLSALLAGRRATLTPPPPSVDYTAILPAGNVLGMFGNDRLGDCTCAAVYHARQVWTANTGAIDTEPDAEAVSLYELACGYNPADPNTDQGGVEQDVLQYWLLAGAPLGSGALDKIAAFVEVDPSNQSDVKLAVNDCGVCYIGFNVPDYAMQEVGQLWDVKPGTPNIVGGHAVVLAAYDAVGPTCITWGQLQKMTWAFFDAFTDEAYMLASPDWVKTTGISPAGYSLADLEAQMEALKTG
jgi:hypothetical protein